MKIKCENSFYYILWLSSPPSFFFIKKSCGAPEFEPGSEPGQVILGLKPAKGSEMKS